MTSGVRVSAPQTRVSGRGPAPHRSESSLDKLKHVAHKNDLMTPIERINRMQPSSAIYLPPSTQPRRSGRLLTEVQQLFTCAYPSVFVSFLLWSHWHSPRPSRASLAKRPPLPCLPS